MFKSILYPALFASLIAIPLIYQKSTTAPQFPNGSSWSQGAQSSYSQTPPMQSEIYGGTVPTQTVFHATPPVNPAPIQSRPAAPVQQVGNQSSTVAKPFALPAMRSPVGQPALSTAPVSSVANPAAHSITAADAWGITAAPMSVPTTGPAIEASGTVGASGTVASPVTWSGAPDITGLTPDFGAAETTVYRGTAAGPDLTAQPMSFVPVNDFREVFRFNLDPTWVKQRFDRISTVPADAGLHGMRTAMVTGTNSWDLHGAQTYYFDSNHRLQRITFRGWVGEPRRLLELATKHFGLKPQPTHWAGLYLGNFGGKLTGGLIMKDPDVIDRRNQVQRMAVLMEINQPSGGFEISDEFRGLIKSAVGSR